MGFNQRRNLTAISYVSTTTSQRMPNVLLPGTKTAILHHTDTSEIVVGIYGSIIERL
ncbi:DUF6016 domain-containing protein [uncultured Prevotella sp.]|uniref:DUF6016 domain-containing protein n=1 Tax=uncultured Prevotella sp. TaxID=159272 RepID=UPI0035AF0862